jgi:hypothetical protein
MVVVGTHQNGIMLSTDHGTTWAKIPGSERATYITSLEWRTATDLTVSTYGRGLWRLQGTFWIPDIGPLCEIVNCTIRYIDRGDPPPDRFRRGVVIFEGQILGMRSADGQLAELFVSPGSSVGYVAEKNEAPKVKVTETLKAVGIIGKIRGLERLPPDGGVVGVALDRNDNVIGLVSAKSNLPISAPTAVSAGEEKEEVEPAAQRSPTAARPYISLSNPKGRADALASGDPLVVTAQRMPAGTAIEVLIDGRVVAKANVSQDGSLSVRVSAPQEPGLHTLTVRDTKTQKVLDGTMFIVGHRDNPKEGRRGQGGHEREGPPR